MRSFFIFLTWHERTTIVTPLNTATPVGYRVCFSSFLHITVKNKKTTHLWCFKSVIHETTDGHLCQWHYYQLAVFERHLYAVLSQLDNPRDKQSGAVVEEMILFPGSKAREYCYSVRNLCGCVWLALWHLPVGTPHTPALYGFNHGFMQVTALVNSA